MAERPGPRYRRGPGRSAERPARPAVAGYPFATGHCCYCHAEVPCDDAHAARSLGRSWRLRCDACRDAGANHADDLAGKLARAVGEQR